MEEVFEQQMETEAEDVGPVIEYAWDKEAGKDAWFNGSDTIEIPVEPAGLYPLMDKVPVSTKIPVKNLGNFMHLKLAEALRAGTFHKSLAFYVGAVERSDASDQKTLRYLKSLANEAFDARHDEEATARVFAKTSEYLRTLKPVRRG